MAIYPGAVVKLIPRHNKPLRATQLVLHTAVSGAASLYGYFANPNTDVASHFYVREDGTVEQYVDTRFQAPANRNANASAISVETWDGGQPNTTPWNARQLVALVALAVWANRVHGVPLRLCSSPTAAGVGFHSMWGAPSAWTPAAGKTCPGTARIPQVASIIATSTRTLLTGSSQEDLLSALTPDEQREVLDRLRNLDKAITGDDSVGSRVDGRRRPLREMLEWIDKGVYDVAKKLGA